MHTPSSRRQFMALGAGLGCLYFAPSVALAGTHSERSLSLHNTHTGESMNATYFVDDKYDNDSLRDLNRLLRDHRQNAVRKMDKGLFDQLWHIQRLLSTADSIEVVSAYRTRKTNNMLRAESNAVAQNSYHPKGRAIDFRLPGIPTWQVRNVALHLKNGGVGYYKRSNFVHIDTGPVRKW